MELSLMEKFADPALFDTLTTGEKAIGALITTCMGMGITFIVLILLWAVIVAMSKVLAKTQKTAISEKAADSAVAQKDINDTELVAAITAAIVAYETSTGHNSSNFVVRKITRIAGNAWGNAGMNECLESRKIY